MQIYQSKYHYLLPGRKRNHEKIEEYKDACIKVGEQHQAVIPSLNTDLEAAKLEEDHQSVLYWEMSEKLDPIKLKKYCDQAAKEHSFDMDQALGILYWHKHNIADAKKTMSKLASITEQWTQEEEDLFRQAFETNGKQFHKIKEFLPGKSVQELVHHFYKLKAKKSKGSWVDWVANKNENNSSFSLDCEEESSFSKKKTNGKIRFSGFGVVDRITASELDEASRSLRGDLSSLNIIDKEIIKLKNEVQQQKQDHLGQEIEKILQNIKNKFPKKEENQTFKEEV